MRLSQLPTREEMWILYRQGEGTTLATYNALTSTMQALEAKVQAVLEDQLKKDNHNKSQSPDSDGFKKPVKRMLRYTGHGKWGEQKGHIGHRLEMVDQPQPINVHFLHGRHCQILLAEVATERVEKRLVFDLPVEISVEVTEHQVNICPRCGQHNVGMALRPFIISGIIFQPQEKTINPSCYNLTKIA